MMMLCDDCILIIADSLSREAVEVLEVILREQGLNRTEIEERTGFSYAYTGKGLDELRYKFLINYETVGRSRCYGLTRIGYRLAELSTEVD
ncbi:MAG: hypothetical protein ACOCZ5_00480 [bacterium]